MALRISQKIPLVITGAALAVAALTGGVSVFLARDALQTAYHDQLLSLLEARKIALQEYKSDTRNDIKLLAQSEKVLRAMDGFNIGRTSIPFDKNKILRDAYVKNNPNPEGEKDKLKDAKDGTAYSGTHRRNHQFFRNFIDTRGYADLMLVGPKGNVVYSVEKQNDYGRNLTKGKWTDTGPAKVYKAVVNADKPDKQAFADFREYAPAGGAASSFIAMPVLGDTSRGITTEKGKPTGVIILQLNGQRLADVMSQSVGMGKTGDIVLVGPDKRMRNDSRLLDGSQVLSKKVDNPAVAAALDGKTGTTEITGLTGSDALALYAPFDFLGTRWAVLAQKNLAEINAPIQDVLLRVALVSVLAAVLVAGAGLLIARGVSRPIKAITAAMRRLAEGDTTIEAPYSQRRDEIGEMAGAVTVFRDNKIEADRLAEEQRLQQETELARARGLEQLAKGFDSTATNVLDTLGQTTEDLRQTADAMNRIAKDTNAKADDAAKASEHASHSVQTVASASEELDASIGSIADQVSTTSQTANDAVQEANRASEQVRGLSEAADKISEVVTLINDIAEQTNLLALNATIEAARAGEAGKGFAVVAGEVKSLANQTAKATEDITSHVKQVQNETQDVVRVIERIGTSIRSIDEQAGAVAGAVEEQRSATQQIAQHVKEAADGTQQASHNIAEVSQVAGEADQAADRVVHAFDQLNSQSKDLRTAVDDFLDQVRNA
jgi:methyl-accepting chemotaxis protein